MTLERELKLIAAEGFVLPCLEGCCGASDLSLDEQRLDATYYDTDDFRLARWGGSLRHRKGEGSPLGIWTVKLPEQTDGALMVRTEHTFDGAANAVPDDARLLVSAFVRTAELRRVARIVTRRRRRELRDNTGDPLLELDDDSVSVYEGRSVSSRFREIEIELHDNAPKKLLREVVGRLEAAGASAAPPRSKVARALGIDDAVPELEARRLGRKASVADVVSAALVAGVRRLIVHDPGVRLGDDPEHVHQARVATRRLRSDLRTFRKYVDPDVARDLRAQLRPLSDALGRVRDADVLYERLAERAAGLPRRDARATATLLRKMTAERTAGRRALLSSLASPGYARLLDQLVAAAEEPPLRPSARKVKAEKALPELVSASWRDLDRVVSQLGPDPTPEALHHVRLLVKRVRYAAEAVAPAIGAGAVEFASAMARLQGLLGDMQDGVVAVAWLRDKGLSASPAAALVAGELITVERELIELGLCEWDKTWKKASRKKLRSWMA